MRVKLTKNTQTQSGATKIGKSRQHQAHRANLPRQLTSDVVPHSRDPVVSCANRSDGGLQTYSLVPLHLRGETPNRTDTPKYRMLEITRTSLIVIKLYRILP